VLCSRVPFESPPFGACLLGCAPDPNPRQSMGHGLRRSVRGAGFESGRSRRDLLEVLVAHSGPHLRSDRAGSESRRMMSTKLAPMTLIAGPCVIEDESLDSGLVFEVAEELKRQLKPLIDANE